MEPILFYTEAYKNQIACTVLNVAILIDSWRYPQKQSQLRSKKCNRCGGYETTKHHQGTHLRKPDTLL